MEPHDPAQLTYKALPIGPSRWYQRIFLHQGLDINCKDFDTFLLQYKRGGDIAILERATVELVYGNLKQQFLAAFVVLALRSSRR